MLSVIILNMPDKIKQSITYFGRSKTKDMGRPEYPNDLEIENISIFWNIYILDENQTKNNQQNQYPHPSISISLVI